MGELFLRSTPRTFPATATRPATSSASGSGSDAGDATSIEVSLNWAPRLPLAENCPRTIASGASQLIV